MTVTVQLSQAVVTATCGTIGTAGAGSRALAVRQATPVTVPRVGPIAKKFSKPAAPDWQATVPQFIAQVTAAGQHYHYHGAMSIIHRITAYEGDDITVRGRPVTEAGVALVRADVDTIRYNLFDLTSATSSTAIHSESLSVSQMFYTALQVTAGWRKDGTGFAFEHIVDGLKLVQGGRVYRIEYVFGLSAGGTIKHAVEVAISGLLTSTSELGY